MEPKAKRLTAAQVILLAADDLASCGATEFTEWDLTMAAWTRDKGRFGLRGWEADHPDHKRMYMEIAGKKPANPLVLGLLAKVGQNVYRITPRGREEAKRLRNGGPKQKAVATVPPVCEVDPVWLELMRSLFADRPLAREALPKLWVHLCRNPAANKVAWEFVAGEWVSTRPQTRKG